MKQSLSMLAVLATLVLALPCAAKERGFISEMRRTLFPPDDLFDLLVKAEIDVATEGSTQDASLKIRYDGPYTFGIMMDRFPRSGPDAFWTKQRVLKARLRLDFIDGTNLLYSVTSTGEYSPFFGLRGSGVTLGSFRTPEDVPLKTEIRCHITITSPDESLFSEYGRVTVYIQKESEK